MSTRREVILSWLCEKRQTWRLCYLLGEAGSGKTWLAQQLDWPPESPDNQYHLFK
ncbi:general secretion pathway protein A [Escherichia coli]|nr:general secretion pathway protein A [Escherichia coli]